MTKPTKPTKGKCTKHQVTHRNGGYASCRYPSIKGKEVRVKAWAVICLTGGYTWAFEHKDAADGAKSKADQEHHGKHKVVPCTITYKLT